MAVDSETYMTVCNKVDELRAENERLNSRLFVAADLLREHFTEWEADSGEWDEFAWHDKVAHFLEAANGQRNANDELLAALSDYRGKVAELQSENKRLREENERMRQANRHSMDVFEDMQAAKERADERVAELEQQEPAAWAVKLSSGNLVTASTDRNAELEWAANYDNATVVPLYVQPNSIIPEGWALVPIKPTAEMKAACRVAGKTRVWADMMAARPGVSDEDKAGGDQ